MPIKIKYNARGQPIAVKIDRDGWIERNRGIWPDGFFEEIIKRAEKYAEKENDNDGNISKRRMDFKTHR